MAKLVLGANKTIVTPAIVKEVTVGPSGPYIPLALDASNALIKGGVPNIGAATDLGDSVFYYAFSGNTATTGAVDFSGLTKISGGNACAYAFQNCTGITSVDLGSLEEITGYNACRYMFFGCTGITSVNLSSLEEATGMYACCNMFQGCTGITTLDLSALRIVSGASEFGGAFIDCTGLTSVDLSSLETIDGATGLADMFTRCTGLTTVSFDSLSVLTGTRAFRITFSYCTNLESLYFPALTSNSFGSYTDQFSSMLLGVSGCEVHFPSNLQSVIGSWSDVQNGFGGWSTTVSFDLPATE